MNVVEAILIEPAVHGGQDIDTTLDKFEKVILEAHAPELVALGRGEEVFETPEWQRQAKAMEDLYPPVFDPEQGPPEREPEPSFDVEDEFADIELPDIDAFKLPHSNEG